MLPRPSDARLGRETPVWATVWSRVCEPASPNASASGSAPTPTESSTRTVTVIPGVYEQDGRHGSRGWPGASVIIAPWTATSHLRELGSGDARPRQEPGAECSALDRVAGGRRARDPA